MLVFEVAACSLYVLPKREERGGGRRGEGRGGQQCSVNKTKKSTRRVATAVAATGAATGAAGSGGGVSVRSHFFSNESPQQGARKAPRGTHAAPGPATARGELYARTRRGAYHPDGGFNISVTPPSGGFLLRLVIRGGSPPKYGLRAGRPPRKLLSLSLSLEVLKCVRLGGRGWEGGD